MSRLEIFLLQTAKRFGWVFCRQSTSNRDAEIIRDKYIKIGKDIGIVEVLRYNQRTLSPAKFKESANHFNFEALDLKYPANNPFWRQDNG